MKQTTPHLLTMSIILLSALQAFAGDCDVTRARTDFVRSFEHTRDRLAVVDQPLLRHETEAAGAGIPGLEPPPLRGEVELLRRELRLLEAEVHTGTPDPRRGCELPQVDRLRSMERRMDLVEASLAAWQNGGTIARGVGGGAISGTVTDSDSQPISSVRIVFWDSSGIYVTDAYTDAAGEYSTDPILAAGSYHARTQNDDGFINEAFDDLQCIDYCSPTAGTPIPVTDGSTTTGVDFELELGGSLSGTVTDAGTASPIPSIQISVYDSAGDYVTTAYSSGSGTYQADSLPAGDYFLYTGNSQSYINEIFDNLPCDGYCWSSDAITTGTPVAVTPGLDTGGVDFSLDLGGSISGTVTAEGTAAPIDNVWVRIHDSDGTYLTTAYTDSSGSYTTTRGLDTGSYFATTKYSGQLDELFDNIPCANSCDPTTGTPIAVTMGTQTPGVDFSLGTGASISGTVTDSSTGEALESIRVRVFDSTGSYVTDGTTDATGAYTSEAGLEPGTYFLDASNSVGYVRELYGGLHCFVACTVTDGTPVVVPSITDVTGIDFALELGGNIVGTVTDAATTDPLYYVWIGIYDSTGANMGSEYTDHNGDYATTSRPLLPGTYYAYTHNWDGYMNEIYDDSPCPGSCSSAMTSIGTPIIVTPGSTKVADFALSTGGAIAGTVTVTASTTPIVGAEVQVFDSTGTFVTSTMTDSSGSYFAYGGVIGGTYYVRTVNNQGYIDELYSNQICSAGCDPTSGTPVTVTNGSTTWQIDFGLSLGASLSGAVTDTASGLPIAGAEVEVFDAGGSMVTTCTTGSDGTFATNQGLPNGTYFARTRSSYLDVLFSGFACPNGCDVTTGTPISLTQGANTGGIDFQLRSALFGDGFESGNMGAWSTSSP
jgi:hypothetical protein